MTCFRAYLLSLLILTGCSASFESLHPGYGSSFNVYDCTYDELWDVAVGVTCKNLTVVDTNKSEGTIKAENRPSLLGWLSNPRPGELVSVSISPGGGKGAIHTIRVVSRSIGRVWPFGCDWEPTIVAGIKSRFPNAVSEGIQKNFWCMTSGKGDTLAGVILERLVSDTLQFSHLGRQIRILASDVSQLRETKERRFWDWVGMGAIIGGIAGSILGPSLSDVEFMGFYGAFYGAFHGMAYGAIIGGSFEALASGDKVFDLRKMNQAERLRTINLVLTGND